MHRFIRSATIATAVVGFFACSADDNVTVPSAVELKTIAVDSGARILELGSRDTLSATTVDRGGDTVAVPVVWRSSNERVAVFERGGVLVARDTGVTAVTASSLGVASSPTPFLVVWLGAAHIDTAGTWSAPFALNTGATLSDSIRVLVTNIHGAAVANAKVAFTVTAGGGSVSPALATTENNGVAATQWTLGAGVGPNTVTASVVRDDGTPNPLVGANLLPFTVTGYNALSVEAGTGQSGVILSDLPVSPSVKLVDSLGAARLGVPVTFTAFSGGRVASSTVPTNAAGVATPGKWTLGDIPGPQILEARVSDAKVSILATGTGTPIRYLPAQVIAGGFSTCALESDGSVKCWGATPQNGSGDTLNLSTPTTVQGSLVASSVTGSRSHFCALTASNAAWCWGQFAFVDTSGQTISTNRPKAMPSDITWSQISPGYQHNCGVSLTQIAYCWGANANGQLGDQTTVGRFVPAPVAGGFQFSQVASGVGHTCGLATDGAAFCWGSNQFGQLGDGTILTRTSPTAVSGGHTFQSIGAGEVLSCALTSDGKAYCWGAVSGTSQTAPVTFPTAPPFTSLSVGGGHACALTADGSAYCWGNNQSGQLGDSTQTTRNTPTKVAGGLHFAQISAGYVHTCARTTAGEVACWGPNGSGELGEMPPTLRTTPRFVVLGVTP